MDPSRPDFDDLPDFDTLVEQTMQRLLAERRIPAATYRVQFNAGFTFRDAQAIVPYLHALGISDLYASPLLQARPGSAHGYDICDYDHLNDALGTWEDFDALVETLHAHGMGLMLDMVPNHMGIGAACNNWWMDVLENGPSSAYGGFFDIDWQPVKAELANKVLLPILEDQYGAVLESGKLRLVYADGAFAVHYYDTRLPVAPDSYARILSAGVDALVEELGAEDEHVQELQSILTALSYLPPYTATEPDQAAERRREKEVIKRRIAALLDATPDVKAAVDAALTAINGDPDDPASFDRLDALLAEQPYRPAFWRVASDEINYRRFFDINDMAAIHIEDPAVFNAVHDTVLDLATAGKINSLRIDHSDGLWNPADYFRRLQESYVYHQICAAPGPNLDDTAAEQALGAAIHRWFDAHYVPQPDSAATLPLYVVTEKILSETEPLPYDWAVFGTTGYDFLNVVNGLFVDPAQRDRLTGIYDAFAGHEMDLEAIVRSSKQRIMEDALASEIGSLSRQLERITEVSRRYRDFTLGGLSAAIRQVIAAMNIYRTYITEPENVSDRDQRYILAAVLEARRRAPNTSRLVLTFIRDTLLLRNLDSFRAEDRPRVLNFVMRFQQITGPIMAKSFEDTTFYIYNRLASLNEVGGHPENFGVTPGDFHAESLKRRAEWPHAMLTTSTHDTKRSEDVRAHIDVLSELPDEWEAALAQWRSINAAHKSTIDGEAAPDANDEYLLYQTLLGAWPDGNSAPGEAFRDRMAAYMVKAASEAKVHTTWISPDEDYIAAIQSFVAGVLGDAAFLDAFVPLQRRVAFFGRFNALAQVLLKVTAPGMPDLYQGTELWNYSLVDPDNRRVVDYEKRREILDDLAAVDTQPDSDRAALARSLVESADDGRIKLYAIRRALAVRSALRDVFDHGSYRALEASGRRAAHLCAFVREHDGRAVIAVAPRLVAGLTGRQERAPVGPEVWGDTWLALPPEHAGRTYRSVFTGDLIAAGERGGTIGLPVAELLAYFPVGLLELI
ncbi:MAG TPA: malto-oligosyltrehalose synthase [Aggregatilinea sp.]|uniref:malto-oligosyltrehalose synthase n=1 Tax=Aggregatilinea sp. TaxID=2806333 RepID=UPI002C20E4D3|nr:malto-oligosyltrehalose synthase [Aggregatilinea sp.]HML22862.1 malto-oligosyltrehalose synthase [Aggregatilinea sp.]